MRDVQPRTLAKFRDDGHDGILEMFRLFPLHFSFVLSRSKPFWRDEDATPEDVDSRFDFEVSLQSRKLFVCRFGRISLPFQGLSQVSLDLSQLLLDRRYSLDQGKEIIF